MIRLSASEVSSLLCYPVRLNPFMPANVQKAIQTGSFLHLKLGFTNSKQFTRIYNLDNEVIEITGIPDRIDYNAGIVEELKTFHTKPSFYKNRKVASIQLLVYEFLTGLNKGKAILFDVKAGKIVSTIEVNFDEEMFRKIIRKALKLKTIQADFLELFNRIQKEELE